jgi:hypothetical protein
LGGGGWSRRTALDDLARSAEEIAIGRRRLRKFATCNPQSVRGRRHLSMPVKHSSPEEMKLQKHQQVRRKTAPKLANPVAQHQFLFYRKFAKGQLNR